MQIYEVLGWFGGLDLKFVIPSYHLEASLYGAIRSLKDFGWIDITWESDASKKPGW